MSISATAIRRHIGTLALTVTALVLGFFFLSQIQVDLLPSITYPRIGVRLNAPGVSPDVAVEEITKPLEQSLSSTEGVVQIYSQTREGSVNLDLYFEPGGDVDQALNEATASFNRAQSRLPDLITDSRLFKVDPSQLPVYEFALRSETLGDADLRVFADQELARELTVVSGVAAVDVSGGVTEEVRIKIDPWRLQSLGLSLNDVLDQLSDRNLDISGGRLIGKETEPLTRTIGKFKTAEEVRDLTFEIQGKTVYLRDFAEVIDGTAKQRVFVTLNGKPAVKISIQKQSDANTIEVVEAVKHKLDQLKDSGLIPADMELNVTLDESIFIRNSLNNVAVSGLTGALLAALAVFLFLGSLRQTLIIVLAIPLASLAAVILMQIFGLSLNIFSLGGLALGVGIVVDNAIVMLETIAESVGMTPGKIDNHHRLNKNWVLRMAEESSSKIESALLASTTTNLVSVLPFLLIGGFFSLLFNELILTISFAVIASLVMAVTVVPVLASRLLAIPQTSGLSQFWLLREFNNRFEASTRSYQKTLFWVLRHRLLIIALALVLLGGGSMILGQDLPQEIIPSINTGQANLRVQFPPGTTLSENRKVMDLVDQIFLKQPETESVFSTAGGSLFGNNTSENVLRGSSTIALKSGTDLENYVENVSETLEELNLVNTRLNLSPERVRGIFFNNSPVRADLDIILQGSNPENLEKAGKQVLKALDEKVKLVRFRPDADPQQPEVQITLDWERMSQYGLSVRDVGDAIQTAIEGSIPTQLQRKATADSNIQTDRLVDIRVELDQEALGDVSALSGIPILIGEGRSISLKDIANIQFANAPGTIQRINQSQVFLIAGTLGEGAKLSDAIAQTKEVLTSLNLPDGITIVPSATEETNQQLQDSLKLLGGLAAFLVFVVMAVQYNSLIDPLVIMFTVPLALAGGIFGLYITQTAVGATVLVGAVLLVGIVVNNAIIMVEFANQIHLEQKCDRRRAILYAAPQRLRPILMTTITTVLGMFPLALGMGEGGEFLQPLGVVVFSGLSLATLLTLFLIPCFYTLLHDLFSPKQITKQYAISETEVNNIITISDPD